RRVAVVALLAVLDRAVAAHRRRGGLRARRAGEGARPPGLHLAVGAAAVDGVAVVALLVALDLPVAAHLDDGVDAGHARLRAHVAGLDLADAGAAVAGDGVAVVARL